MQAPSSPDHPGHTDDRSGHSATATHGTACPSERYLIIANKTGQLGNRLTVYAHMLGAARECGWQLLNPSFCEYAQHFVGTCGRLMTCGAEQANVQAVSLSEREQVYRINRLAYKCSHVLQHVAWTRIGWARASDVPVYDLGELMARAQRRGWRWLFTQNYVFREHTWCARHADHIRQVFTPLPIWTRAAEAALARARGRAELVVGVHIRHGDYRDHLGGRFFYPAAAYAELMRRMAALVAPRSVAFLVCSNAVHDPGCFEGLDIVPGPGHLVADLHALSLCDHLMGPPSSFSSWAAFHGDKPLYVVEDPQRLFTLGDFSVSPSVNPRF